MKNHLFLVNLTVSGIMFLSVEATAQLTVTTPQIIAQNLSEKERRELQILRQERQKLQQEREIRNLVQTEIDRALSRTTSLFNILLFVMILLPIVTVVGIWLLRRSIINQLVTEIKQELQTEIQNQTVAFQQEIAQWQARTRANANIDSIGDSIGENQQFSELISEASLTLPNTESQYITETSETQQFVHPEANHFIAAETQTLMSQDQYEMSSITQIDQPVLPELNNHQENEIQPLSIDEYLNLGNSHLSKSRYQDAIEAYNAALKIERNFPEARYQNARAYALRGSVNPAIGNLQWAIDLDSQYKEIAKTDSAFDYIRNDEQFQQLVND
jgi:tetratricopeptide (TPR) repeat protein